MRKEAKVTGTSNDTAHGKSGALAPLARLKGRTRYQLLVRARTHAELVKIATPLQAASTDLGAVRVVFDMDPLSMM